MRGDEQDMLNFFNEEKLKNVDCLEELENQIVLMEKKVCNKELQIEEQIEAIERRMEYMELKKTKIITLIEEEQVKIKKVNEKYEDEISTLKSKLEEALNDEKMTLML